MGHVESGGMAAALRTAYGRSTRIPYACSFR
jgi:hypothetical protein